MSTLLMAVKSCHEHRAGQHHESIRKTWGSDLFPPHNGIEQQKVLFFMGGSGQHLKADEIILSVDDSYEGLPSKTREILRYFLHRPQWDFIFLCDTDTFCVPKLFGHLGYENYDVAGHFTKYAPLGVPFKHTDNRQNVIEECYTWPSGGVGYFLSRKAASVIVKSEPLSWAEDVNTGLILGPYIAANQITAVDLPEFFEEKSWHFSPQQYHSKYNVSFKWQEHMHAQKRLS